MCWCVCGFPQPCSAECTWTDFHRLLSMVQSTITVCRCSDSFATRRQDGWVGAKGGRKQSSFLEPRRKMMHIKLCISEIFIVVPCYSSRVVGTRYTGYPLLHDFNFNDKLFSPTSGRPMVPFAKIYVEPQTSLEPSSERRRRRFVN